MNAISKNLAGSPARLDAVIRLGNEVNNSEAKFVGELLQEGVTHDAKQVRKLVESVAKDSIEKDATLPGIVRTIAAIEGRGSDYYTSQEAIDTANAVLRMANGTATKSDYALIERSEGARTVVLSAEGTKAWDSLKAVAQKDADARIDMKASKSGIGMKKSVSEYPYDMKKVISDYIDSTNKFLLEKVKKFRTDKSAKFERVNLGNVTDRESADIKKLTGDDVSGYIHAINSNAFNHIEKRHGENGQHDSTMANPEDVARVEYVLENYDSVELAKKENGDIVYSNEFRDSDNEHSPLLVYSKKINGTYYAVVASAENAYKKLWVVTTYMSKNKEGITQELHDELSSLSLTSETKLASLPSTDSISKDKATVNSKDMQKGGKDAHSEKKVPSPEEAKRAKNVDKGIVVSEESKKLKKENLRAYNNIGKLATSLNTRAVVVSGLKNSKGEALAGKLSGGVIYVNADVGADKISRWAALHEASHLIKQKAAKIWQRFENYAIKRLEDTGEYKVKYELKKDDYKAAEINEELACDYIGELFESEAELTEFIRTDKSLAVKVRDFFYNALSRWGLFGERKKAQALWLKAYKTAMKSDAKSEQNKFKIITMSDGSRRKYVHATQRVIKSKDPAMWEYEIIDYVNKTVRKGNDVVIPFDNDESITITGRTAWKLGDKGKMPNKFYLVKGNAAGVIDEVVEVSKSVDSSPPYKEHSDDFAKYGFDYRRAYFMDLDGKYYELTLSVGINEEGKEAYNIGYIKRTTFPVTGSKARSSKLYGKSSSTPMVSQDKPGVKNNSMQNDGNYVVIQLMGDK